MLFEKTISTLKGTLRYYYNGTPKKEGVDNDKTKKLLDKIFNNNCFGNDIKRIVTYLRTILIDYEEEYLFVETRTENIQRDVRYYDGKLTRYNKSEILKDISSNKDKISFQYDASGESTFSFSNISEELKDYLLKEKLKEFVSSEMDYVFCLKNIKPVDLDKDSKIIITIYNLFYGKLPDLSDLDIETKLQNMLYILSMYGISVEIKEDEVSFARWGKYPESPILGDWLREVIPLATNVEVFDSSKLNKKTVKIITMVAEEIQYSFFNKSNKNLSFERFCYAVYCKNYVYRSNISLKEMAEKMKNEYFGKFFEEELEYYFELIEKMCKKYNKLFIK